MNIDSKIEFDTMSEAELEPVLELLQGGNPDVIARKAGISRQNLFRIRDDLLAQVEHERVKAKDMPSKKVGRNEPCPCGSGKKYKHCCLTRHQTAAPVKQKTADTGDEANAAEQEQLIRQIEETFSLIGSERCAEAINRASRLIETYPNEDRLHDILATGHMYLNAFDAAIDICRSRLAIAELEKAYFIEKGRYREATIDQPALSYYYPPLTWLQKYWIALKAESYQALYPLEEDPAGTRLV